MKVEKMESADFKVLLGDAKTKFKGLSKDIAANWKKFLKSDRDTWMLDELNSGFYFVKKKTKNEGQRQLGAKAFNALKGSANSVEVLGDVADVYPFLEGMSLAGYSFRKYKTEEAKTTDSIDYVFSPVLSDEQAEELNNTINIVYWTRDLVNEPVSYLTAEQLASELETMSETVGITTKVLEKTQIESLKMGGLLAVNKGSIDPPTFSIMEYKPKKAKNKKPYVLVGKGVVYDTGGLSLKPTPNSMDVMKSDMGGAACVAGAISLIAAQELPVHVIALIPATDNRPGLNAYAPGDVVTMYNGSTVEVLNTDAEGRMILADALSYSKKYDPELVIDAATLTGAAHRAIGDKAAIIMGNADQKYFDMLEKAGTQSHERVVQFPFWDDYYEEMKSKIADLKNIGGPTAGMITAGKFLEHFVESPYVHMDIAGPAWLDGAKGYNTAGGTGYGVRLLYQFFKNI
jgi:leucyl aminopeptidase